MVREEVHRRGAGSKMRRKAMFRARKAHAKEERARLRRAGVAEGAINGREAAGVARLKERRAARLGRASAALADVHTQEDIRRWDAARVRDVRSASSAEQQRAKAARREARRKAERDERTAAFVQRHQQRRQQKNKKKKRDRRRREKTCAKGRRLSAERHQGGGGGRWQRRHQGGGGGGRKPRCGGRGGGATKGASSR